MAEMLKPCPLCGSTDVKHYVTNARERNRGVIVCKNCGLRLEAYSDDEYKVAQAYQGDFESAHEFTWEQARRAVAAAWNRRAERTCRVERVSTPYHAGPPRCSACMMPLEPLVNYCPYCGARVVSER